MKQSSIQIIIDSILMQMELSGMAAATIENYIYFFKTIINFYYENHVFNFSKQLNDNFISYINEQLNLNIINRTKWNNLSRAMLLLNQFVLEDKLDLIKCSIWEEKFNPLKRQPTKDELLDSENILVLIRRTENEFHKLHLKKSTFNEYRLYGFEVILKLHNESNLTHYSKQLIDKTIKQYNYDYLAGKISKKSFFIFRKSCLLIQTVYNNEKIAWLQIRKGSNIQIPSNFQLILDDFSNDKALNCEIKKSTLKSITGSIRLFINEISKLDVNSFDALSPTTFNIALINRLKNKPKSQNTELYALNLFFNYLFKNRITNINFSIWLPKRAAPRRQVIEGFSQDFNDYLLSFIDKSTSLGKRNYAIIQLAIQTGLRGCDIVDLKRENIDWHSKEIHIVQKKTGKLLNLPLPVESGNAIADYLLNGRPIYDEPYIFICESPIRKITIHTLDGIIKKYIKYMPQNYKKPIKMGFHNFRRSFGKNLLTAETSLDLLSEILGHSNVESVKSYIYIDENGLKECCLSLIDLSNKSCL
jgi:site-specific recombinase XerD